MLKREAQPMPQFVKEMLAKEKLLSTYEARPAYQRNDYLGWISRAKKEETKEKRLRQMLDELRRGDVYMNMRWRGRK